MPSVDTPQKKPNLFSKVLLVRMDRIGDLVLTLPTDVYLPQESVYWLISKGLEFIPSNSVPKRRFISFDKRLSLSNLNALVSYLKKENFDAAIVFHAPWWVSLAIFLAGIPLRAGKKSRWDSFVFFNKAIRQKRSESVKHEMEYNSELVAKSMDLNLQKIEPLTLKTDLSSLKLQTWGLSEKNYIVVHPGMGGSALNWPIQNYFLFIQILSRQVLVVVTGTKIDSSYIDELKKQLKDNSNITWLNEKLSAEELLLVLKYARCVLAPSTGVIHLAASLGSPVVGLFSPRKVESPTRWGPLGKNVMTLLPESDSSGQKADEKDMSFDERVMEKIKLQNVVDNFLDMMKR